MTQGPQSSTLYERVGKEPFFVDLVEKFYEGVEQDPLLRPMYPDDLEPGKANLAQFLAQYWGGPPNYSMRKGHPRLRMRHASFHINQPARDAWMRHMTDAVARTDASPQDKSLLLAYFNDAATFMINSPN